MKVSILTPTFNSAAVLDTNLRSVALQDYPDIEQIIIDNNSSDDTLDLANGAKHHVRVLNGPDSGIYDALNKGLAAATGDIIGILHSDDFFTKPDVISAIVAALQSDELDAVFGDVVMVDRKNINRITRYWKSSDFSKAKFIRGWMPPHPSLYIRRTFYQKHGGYDSSFRISGDYALMVRYFILHGMHTKRLDRVLVTMRRGGSSDGGLRQRLKMWREDARAWREAGFKIKWYTLPLKVLRKAGQFFVNQ